MPVSTRSQKVTRNANIHDSIVTSDGEEDNHNQCDLDMSSDDETYKCDNNDSDEDDNDETLNSLGSLPEPNEYSKIISDLTTTCSNVMVHNIAECMMNGQYQGTIHPRVLLRDHLPKSDGRNLVVNQAWKQVTKQIRDAGYNASFSMNSKTGNMSWRVYLESEYSTTCHIMQTGVKVMFFTMFLPMVILVVSGLVQLYQNKST